jgi:PAS domain S-box-containing protein
MVRASEMIEKAGPIRILAVDDNPAALSATSRVLESAGYEVIQATTGAAALDMAGEVDLVVLDVNLPDMHGLEVRRRLRARPDTARIPLLHLSATFTQTDDSAQGFEAGADSYLTRPVEAPVLIATVRTLLFASHAEHLRRGLDATLRTMFELAPVGIAILDDRFIYTSVNPCFCALTGYSPDELVGQPATFGVDSPLRLEDLTAAPVDGTGLWLRQLRFRKKDGSVAEVEWQIARENISATRILSATDITQRLHGEQAREELLLKEEFLTTLSHELRNPLHAIVGWAAILNRVPDLPAPVLRGLQAIDRNSKIQARMISDLQDYAGITSGKIRLVPENINPYTTVRAAIDVVSSVAAGAEVKIHESFADATLRVDADPARLQQIVVNLLSNAIKFSPKGAVVELRAGGSGGYFTLEVTDHGNGIEPQFLPRIFQRFSRQDAATTKSHGGLGLGLAIVKQLVDLHRGAIDALSGGKGLGSTFRLKIPLSNQARQ